MLKPQELYVGALQASAQLIRTCLDVTDLLVPDSTPLSQEVCISMMDDVIAVSQQMKDRIKEEWSENRTASGVFR